MPAGADAIKMPLKNKRYGVSGERSATHLGARVVVQLVAAEFHEALLPGLARLALLVEPPGLVHLGLFVRHGTARAGWVEEDRRALETREEQQQKVERR